MPPILNGNAGRTDAQDLTNNAVTQQAIGPDAVDSEAVGDLVILEEHLADDSVAQRSILPDAVGAPELAALSLELGKYIRSNTYVAGSSGWAIDADGSAEFSDVTIRGVLDTSAAGTTSGFWAEDNTITFYTTAGDEVGELGFYDGAFDTFDALRVKGPPTLGGTLDQTQLYLRNHEATVFSQGQVHLEAEGTTAAVGATSEARLVVAGGTSWNSHFGVIAYAEAGGFHVVDGSWVDKFLVRTSSTPLVESNLPVFIRYTDSDVTETDDTGALIIGADGGLQLGFDANEIQARDAGAVSSLHLNNAGGDVYLASNDTVFIRSAESSSLTDDSGVFVIGADAGQQLGFDPNTIQSRDAGVAASLHLNANGGDVILWASAGNPSLVLRSTSDVSTTADSGVLVIGASGGTQVGFDNNEIVARAAGGGAGTLLLNSGSGPVQVSAGSGGGDMGLQFGSATRGLFADTDCLVVVANTTGRFEVFDNGAGTVSARPRQDNAVDLGTSGRRWTAVWAVDTSINSSDERIKSDIEDEELGLDFILGLRPVSYRWTDGGVRRHHGLLADQVMEAARAAGASDFAGYIDPAVGAPSLDRNPHEPGTEDHERWIEQVIEDRDAPKGLRYGELWGPAIRALQEMHTRLTALEQGRTNASRT